MVFSIYSLLFGDYSYFILLYFLPFQWLVCNLFSSKVHFYHFFKQTLFFYVKTIWVGACRCNLWQKIFMPVLTAFYCLLKFYHASFMYFEVWGVKEFICNQSEWSIVLEHARSRQKHKRGFFCHFVVGLLQVVFWKYF